MELTIRVYISDQRLMTLGAKKKTLLWVMEESENERFVMKEKKDFEEYI